MFEGHSVTSFPLLYAYVQGKRRVAKYIVEYHIKIIIVLIIKWVRNSTYVRPTRRLCCLNWDLALHRI